MKGLLIMLIVFGLCAIGTRAIDRLSKPGGTDDDADKKGRD